MSISSGGIWRGESGVKISGCSPDAGGAATCVDSLSGLEVVLGPESDLDSSLEGAALPGGGRPVSSSMLEQVSSTIVVLFPSIGPGEGSDEGRSDAKISVVPSSVIEGAGERCSVSKLRLEGCAGGPSDS